MEHIELYGRLRESLLSRRFAFNGPWRVNFPSFRGEITTVAKLADFMALPPADQVAARWSTTHFQGENPWAAAGAALAVALSVESRLGHAHARGVLHSLLESTAAQFRFSGAFAGYPIRWDPVAAPPQSWRTDAGGNLMYAKEFGVTSERYDFANSPRDFRALPRRAPATLAQLLGGPATAEATYATYYLAHEAHRAWEMSQDEVFGLVAGLFAIHQFSDDASLQSESRGLLAGVADYLARNGYLMVKPGGGLVGRGSGDALVGSEFALGRGFNTVLGDEHRSQVDWAGAMTRAGYWSQLATPIAIFTAAGAVGSVIPGSPLSVLSTLLTSLSPAVARACPAVAAAARDVLLPAKLLRAFAVHAHNDVFDPFHETYRDEPAQSIFYYEYDRRTRYQIYSEICGLGKADASPTTFMTYTGLLAVDDPDPVARQVWAHWLDLRNQPVGQYPRGLPPDSTLYGLAVACLLLGAAYETALRDALDARKTVFADSFDGDLEVRQNADGSGPVYETATTASDYLAGLAMAWLYARRRTDLGATLVNGFPMPPTAADLAAMPRPTRDGQDLWPNDAFVPRWSEPAVRVPAPPDADSALAVDRTFVVRESDTEVDTGIAVHYGDIFHITATGSIQPNAPWGTNGPNGVAGNVNFDARWPLHSGIDPTNSSWSLLARLNGWFEVGADSGRRRWIYDTQDDGGDAARRLFLRINDDTAGNGSGSFAVRVRVWGTERLTFEHAAAADYEWIFPPIVRFNLTCGEPCGPPLATVSVQMPDGSFVPIIGERIGGLAPGPDQLDGPIVDHPALLNSTTDTTLFWLGRVTDGRSLYGRNDTFTFRLEAKTARGYFGTTECTTPIHWHGEQISCIDRPAGAHRILGVGGTDARGRTWSLTEAQTIAEIERGHTFFTEQPTGHRANVVVEHTAAGRKFLRTAADSERQNNLLSLPQCPT